MKKNILLSVLVFIFLITGCGKKTETSEDSNPLKVNESISMPQSLPATLPAKAPASMPASIPSSLPTGFQTSSQPAPTSQPATW